MTSTSRPWTRTRVGDVENAQDSRSNKTPNTSLHFRGKAEIVTCTDYLIEKRNETTMEVSQSAAPVATAAPAAAMAQPVAVAAAEPAVVAVTASQPELEANGQAASYIAADVAGQAQTAAAVAAPPAAAAAAAAVPTPTPAPDKEEEEAPPAKKIRIEETAPTEVRICFSFIPSKPSLPY